MKNESKVSIHYARRQIGEQQFPHLTRQRQRSESLSSQESISSQETRASQPLPPPQRNRAEVRPSYRDAAGSSDTGPQRQRTRENHLPPIAGTPWGPRIRKDRTHRRHHQREEHDDREDRRNERNTNKKDIKESLMEYLPKLLGVVLTNVLSLFIDSEPPEETPLEDDGHITRKQYIKAGMKIDQNYIKF